MFSSVATFEGLTGGTLNAHKREHCQPIEMSTSVTTNHGHTGMPRGYRRMGGLVGSFHAKPRKKSALWRCTEMKYIDSQRIAMASGRFE